MDNENGNNLTLRHNMTHANTNASGFTGDTQQLKYDCRIPKVCTRYIGDDDGELVQCMNPWSIRKVTDLQRNVRVVRKPETGPDARMGNNPRMGSERTGSASADKLGSRNHTGRLPVLVFRDAWLCRAPTQRKNEIEGEWGMASEPPAWFDSWVLTA
jgi:hypothetical protein